MSIDSLMVRKLFTTITASTYHPLLQRQLPLATMECKSEDIENVGRFWSTFNKAYKDANQTNDKFDPIGFVSDMATANFTGLQIVYGEEITSKIKGCEFHYEQSLNKRKSKVGQEKQGIFIVSALFFTR